MRKTKLTVMRVQNPEFRKSVWKKCRNLNQKLSFWIRECKEDAMFKSVAGDAQTESDYGYCCTG